MINNLGTTDSAKNTPRTSALSKFMLGTTVAATMAIAPVQNVVAADTAPKTLKTPSAQNIMPGWYVLQADGKFVPYISTNPEHTKASRVYKLALDPKTNVYKAVHEELKTPNQEPGLFTKITNGASNFMRNTMSGTGKVLGSIGQSNTPQPAHNTSPVQSRSADDILNKLTQEMKEGKYLGKQTLSFAREAYRKIVVEKGGREKVKNAAELEKWLSLDINGKGIKN